MGTINFREANASDARAIGAVHVASWRETYGGLLPDALLSGLSADARAAMWREILSGWDGTVVFVAESDTIVGFGACGTQRDEALKNQGFDGEFGAIYVLKAHQRGGVGSALMRLLARELLQHGRTAATLWVLRDNVPARSFYERLGGTLLGERVEEQSGAVLSEVAYGWRDVTSLMR